ncbi:MAG: hypothetical protein AABW68_03535 [archaeon]
MATMTLAIPDSLRRDMRQFPEVKWSEVARKAIAERIETLRIAEGIASKSKLTTEDVKKFSQQIKANAHKRLYE